MKNLDQPSSRVLWADAAAVCAVVLSLILAARSVRPLAEAGAFLARTGESLTALPASTWPRAAAWVAISVMVLARWRIAAAVGAWAAVGYEIVVLAMRVNGDPAYIDPLNVMAWPLVLAAAAAALLSVPAPVGRGLDLLGRRGMWLLGAAAAVTTLMATAIPLLGEYYGPPPAGSVDPGFFVVFAVSSQLANAIQGLTLALVFALTVAAVMAVDRAVRYRVFTVAGAGALGLVAIELGLPRPFGLWEMPVLSGAAQAVLLVLAPSLALGIGWFLVRHNERTPRTNPVTS